jgi:TonB family protein
LPLRLETCLPYYNPLFHEYVKNFPLLFLFLLFSISSLNAQTSLSEATRKADVAPAWPGCDPKIPDCTKSRLTDFINANLQIPLDAKKENAGGVVAMEFVIEKSGMIGEVHAMHDPGLGLVQEATRVINLMNSKKIKWSPAEDDGKKVPYRYIIPVSFNLAAPPKEKTEMKPAGVPTDGIYDVVEVMPRYQGCEKAVEDSVDCTFRKMVGHIKSQMKYPEEALKLKISGQVIVEFVIDTNGAVTRPSIKQGIGTGCDEEALRVVSSMPAGTRASKMERLFRSG